MTIELAAFPSGTPSREAMEWVYRHVPLVRFMRTTQKAAPLVAIGVAGLLGLAAQAGVGALRARGCRGRRWRAGLAALIALAALPLVRGTAIEKQLTWKRIPAAWTDVGRDLDKGPKPNSRALVLPGQIFANYTWGGTTDAILPRVTKRPVAVRYETPYGDPRSTDLLWTVDRLVSAGPAAARPAAAAAAPDGRRRDRHRQRRRPLRAAARSTPPQAAAELDGQGLDRRRRPTARRERSRPPAASSGPPRELPEVRRYDVGGVRGIVHVDGSGPATIVDGGAEGLAGLAAFGALPASSPILYAGRPVDGPAAPRTPRAAPRSWSATPTAAAASCRSSRRQNLGATLPAKEPLDPNQAIIDPFPDRGTDAQTVAVLKGASYVRAPNAGGLLEFPERDAIKAFDGDPRTVWSADRYYHPRSRWIEIGFEQAARRGLRRAAAAPRRERPGDRGRHQRRARQGRTTAGTAIPVRPQARRQGADHAGRRQTAAGHRPARQRRPARGRASPACTCASRCARRC